MDKRDQASRARVHSAFGDSAERGREGERMAEPGRALLPDGDMPLPEINCEPHVGARNIMSFTGAAGSSTHSGSSPATLPRTRPAHSLPPDNVAISSEPPTTTSIKRRRDDGTNPASATHVLGSASASAHRVHYPDMCDVDDSSSDASAWVTMKRGRAVGPFIVRVWGGAWSSASLSCGMDRTSVLEALAETVVFGRSLKDKDMAAATVNVGHTTQDDGPTLTELASGKQLLGVRTLAQVLQQTQGDDQPAARRIFLDITLQPPAESAHTGGIGETRSASLRTINAFLRALEMASVRDIEGGCQLLVLPPAADGRSVTWLGMDSNVLFVRPVFRTLYEDHLCHLRYEMLAPGARKTLLRGVPGIGKSSFGQYVLWRLIKDRRNATYVYPKGLGKSAYITLNSGDGITIFDGEEPDLVAPVTLLISSPRGGPSRVFDEFKKHAASMFMPTPSREEVHLMAKYCFTEFGDAVTSDKIDERMDRWGPIPRFVLERWRSEREELQQAIAKQQVNALRSLVRSNDDEIAATEVSFRILHYVVSGDYRTASYVWGSQYIETKVAEKLNGAAEEDRLSLLRQMLADHTWRSLSGKLFENWCSVRMKEGGTFRIRRLEPKLLPARKGRPSARALTSAALSALHEQAAKQADARLGLQTLDARGYGLLSLKPAARTQSLVAADGGNLLGCVDVQSVRYQARTGFAAVDFVEVGGIPSNSTVSQSHELLVLGSNPRNGVLPLIKWLNGALSQPLFPESTGIPFLWLVPAEVFDTYSVGQTRLGKPEASTCASDAEKVALEAAYDAAKQLAPYIVQYAVEVPIESRPTDRAA